MAPFLLCGPLATVPVARVPECQPAMGLTVVPTSVCSEEDCVRSRNGVVDDNAKHNSGSFLHPLPSPSPSLSLFAPILQQYFTVTMKLELCTHSHILTPSHPHTLTPSHPHTLTVQPRPAGHPAHRRAQGAGGYFVTRKHSFL